jgi:hypothetical protein
LLLWEKTRDIDDPKQSLRERSKRIREMADFFGDMDKAKIIKKKVGRPFRYGEPTKLCRIPLSFEPVLSVLLLLWEKTRDIDDPKQSLIERSKRMREMADFFGDYETIARQSGGKK